MDKFFQLKERGTTVRTEILAGLTTFLASAYILAVNPGILGAVMPQVSVFTATALASALATLVMALVANLPIALAPAMGLNAYFTYTVVQGMGYSYQVALTAVFLEGILFIILSLARVRETIIKAIPNNLKIAIAVGIGLFITLLGLSNAGIAVNNTGTIIAFSPLRGSALLAIIGFIIMAVLMALKVKGAILIGIVVTTIIGIPMGITHVPVGDEWRTSYAAPLLFHFDFSNVFSLKFFTVFFAFLFVDMFDTLGTLMGLAEQSNLKDEQGNIKNVNRALLSDAIGTTAGAALGTSTVTSFVTSSTGIAEGGRTGLASVVTAMLFLVSIAFAPFFLMIPSAATAPALIMVGFMMMKSIAKVDFTDITEGIPAFVAIIVMPFAYSIDTSISWSIMSYVILKVATRKFKDITLVTWILFAVFVLKTVLDARA